MSERILEMGKYGLKATQGLILMVTVLMLPGVASASTPCTGTLSGTFDNVIIDGGSCTLDGATVRGSVLVSGGGTLKATGGTTVAGDINSDSGGNIDLEAVTVLGDVTLTDSGDVTVGSAANIAALLVNSSGAIFANGSLASIQASASGGISLDGATVFPGSVEMVNGSGGLKMCGSTVEGVVNVVGTTGDVAVDRSAFCGASTIDGMVSVAKGIGDVRLLGASLPAGDLIVIEQVGDIYLKNTALSDVKVQGITGNVTLVGVTTDSDTSVAGITGHVRIESSNLRDLFGDVEIKSAGHVTLYNTSIASDASISDSGSVMLDSLMIDGDVSITSNGGVVFSRNYVSFEDVMIFGNRGLVAVNENVDLSLSIIENNDVTVTGNAFTDAEVSKNTGVVSIVGNTGEKLNCTDNNPAPTGWANIITELTDGQCTGF